MATRKPSHPQINAGGRARRGDGELARAERKAATLTRNDGWANVLTGARTHGDYRQHSRFRRHRELTVNELEDMYRQDALTRRIVDKRPALITRDPFKIEGDTDNKIWQYLFAKKFISSYRRGLTWGQLYGGSVVIIGANDGRDLEEPLNINRIRSIDFFRVYDRYCITGNALDWNRDPNNARFGQRDYYTIYPRGVVIPQASFRVHYSRVIQCDGVMTTDVQMAKNYGWCDSIMQYVYNDMRTFLTGLDDSGAVIRDFVQGVLNVKGLDSKIGNVQGETQLKARLEMMDLTRHMLNTMMLDENEIYEKKISSITGLPDLLDRLMAMVSVAADMPQSILFGRAPQGMNATGEMDIRAWYDNCTSYRAEIAGPVVQEMAEIAQASGDFRQQQNRSQVNFAALWTPTDKEQADMRYQVAQADAVYIDRGVLSPEEVATSRFGGESYSVETQLAEDRDPIAPMPSDEQAELDAAAARAAAAGGGSSARTQ